VVIHNFDRFRPSFRPVKTDTPLVIDANAVLSQPITFQDLKPITGRNAQVVQISSRMQLVKLAGRDQGNLLGNATGELTVEDRLGIPIFE